MYEINQHQNCALLNREAPLKNHNLENTHKIYENWPTIAKYHGIPTIKVLRIFSMPIILKS